MVGRLQSARISLLGKSQCFGIAVLGCSLVIRLCLQQAPPQPSKESTGCAHGGAIDSDTADSNSRRVNGLGKTLRTPSWRATTLEEPIPRLSLAERSRIG